jgi:hypothetical protein
MWRGKFWNLIENVENVQERIYMTTASFDLKG